MNGLKTDAKTDTKKDANLVEPEWLGAALLEAKLGYSFRSIELLETALQHSSYAHEKGLQGEDSRQSNERLEFLGDSVLGVVVADALYNAHPKWAEGDLTLALQNLVNQRSLAKVATELGLGEFLRLGRTERQSFGANKPGILSDAVEAVLGAMFLDGGLAPVQEFLARVFEQGLSEDAVQAQRDPKTRFQEWMMARTNAFPTYECIGDNGIDGDENRFTVKVVMGEENWGEGTARSKRKAERLAAERALERVDAAEREDGK